MEKDHFRNRLLQNFLTEIRDSIRVMSEKISTITEADTSMDVINNFLLKTSAIRKGSVFFHLDNLERIALHYEDSLEALREGRFRADDDYVYISSRIFDLLLEYTEASENGAPPVDLERKEKNTLKDLSLITHRDTITPGQNEEPLLILPDDEEETRAIPSDQLKPDALMGLTSKLVEMQKRAVAASGDAALLNEIGSIAQELRSRLKKLTRKSFAKTLKVLKREAAHVITTQKKKVRLRITSDLKEMDTRFIDILGIHLMKILTSIITDHIESPEERIRSEKNPIARLRLLFRNRPEKYQIDILHDGAPPGIDQMLLEDLARAVHGSFEIFKNRDPDTTILTLNIPLDYNLIPLIMFTSGNERYAVPATDVAAIHHKDKTGSIVLADGISFFRDGNDAIPVVDLNTVMSDNIERGISGPYDSMEKLPKHLLLISAYNQKLALPVDSVPGEIETAVSPLSDMFVDSSVFSAAIAENGEGITLVLDVHALAHKANLTEWIISQDETLSGNQDVVQGKAAHRFLMVRSGPEKQFALPLTEVLRVEPLPGGTTPDMSESSGRKGGMYWNLYGSRIPVIRIGSLLGTPGSRASEPRNLVIAGDDETLVGILCDVVQTFSDYTTYREGTTKEPFFLGTADSELGEFQFVNLAKLVNQKYPDTIQSLADQKLKSRDSSRTYSALLWSRPGFGTSEKTYLLGAMGIDVTQVTDEVEVWEKVNLEGFDLFICDTRSRSQASGLVKKLRNHRKFPLKKVLLISDEPVQKKSSSMHELIEPATSSMFMEMIRKIITQS